MTEREMIARCAKGDREAFNELIEKYQKQVFNTAYAMLSNYEDASDASQEVFIKLYRSIASFKGQSAFSTWLYTICRSVCSDMLRKRQRRGVTLSIDSGGEEGETAAELPSDEPSPEERCEMSERQRTVRSAIAQLSPEYREVIVYSDLEQLSYEEIAKILKCPTGTVKSRLNRARNALKKKLSESRELF